MALQHHLQLKALEVSVRLGCFEEERAEPQVVRFTLRLRFPDRPQACESDAIEDTICYEEIARVVSMTAQAREFRLVEHLAWTVHQKVGELLPPSTVLSLKLHKPSLPMDFVTEGAVYEISGECG